MILNEDEQILEIINQREENDNGIRYSIDDLEKIANEMDNKQIVIDYLKDLYQYHCNMKYKSKVKNALDYHYRAERDLLDVLKLIDKGKSKVWIDDCYIKEEFCYGR